MNSKLSLCISAVIPAAALARLNAALRNVWRVYAEQRRRRKAMADLQALSDDALKDIGVRRSEIYWVIHHGRYEPRITVQPVALPASSRLQSRWTALRI